MTMITDDDNLQHTTDGEGEWVETPKGNFAGQIELEPRAAKLLIESWIRNNVGEASQELFLDKIGLGGSEQYQSAVYEAILNEALQAALKEHISTRDLDE